MKGLSLEAHAIRLGKSLRHALGEHGTPNSFQLAELTSTPMTAGRAMRRHWSQVLDAAQLTDDFQVTYQDGRIHVDRCFRREDLKESEYKMGYMQGRGAA